MTGRLYRAGIQDAPAVPHGRLYDATFAGGGTVVPHGRLYRAGASSVAGVSVIAPPGRGNVEPGDAVTLVAALSGGGAADSWLWRIISGGGSILETGPSATFTAPSVMPPSVASSVVGVQAVKDGATSPEVTTTVQTLPQIKWRYVGGQWVGRRSVQL